MMINLIYLCILLIFFAKAQNSLIPFEKDNLFGFMNLDTQTVIPNQYIYLLPFTKNGLVKVMETGGKFGFINTKGQYILNQPILFLPLPKIQILEF